MWLGSPNRFRKIKDRRVEGGGFRQKPSLEASMRRFEIEVGMPPHELVNATSFAQSPGMVAITQPRSGDIR